MPAHSGWFSSCSCIRKTGNTKRLESTKNHSKKKGGRPRKAVKKDQLLGVKCTLIERRAIEAKARSVDLSVSEYLRETGLSGKIDIRKKALPGEVLKLSGTLNHLAANMNQVAKKRNQNDELNAIERATLQQDVAAIKQLVREIKNYLQ